MSDRIAFTQSHEWVSIEGNRATVGITRYARGEIGEVVSVALPKVGSHIEAGQEICILESTKAAIDVYSPLSGEVVAVNEKLREDPGLINRSPEASGWLFQVERFDPKELEQLLTLAKYREYTERDPKVGL